MPQTTPPAFLPTGRTHRPPRADKTAPLTEPQRTFMAAHYEYALQAGRRVARGLGVPGHWADDLVEDAAVEALLNVSRRSADPDFVPATAKQFLFTAVYRQVRHRLARFCGGKGPDHAGGRTDFVVGGRFPDPAREAVRREEEARLGPAVERARRLIGELAEVWKKNGRPNEFAIFRGKALELGLAGHGSPDQLRDRIAAHVRGRLFGSRPAGTAGSR